MDDTLLTRAAPYFPEESAAMDGVGESRGVLARLCQEKDVGHCLWMSLGEKGEVFTSLFVFQDFLNPHFLVLPPGLIPRSLNL